MRLADISKGDIVYHKVFTTFGKGVVLAVRTADGLERLFERGCGNYRAVVQFEAHDTPTAVLLSAIQSKPNKKKIREMVEYYQRTGRKASDGGDRLIIEPANTPAR